MEPRVGVPDRLGPRRGNGLCIVETTGVRDVAAEDHPLDAGVVVDEVELAVGRGEEARLGVGELEVLGVGRVRRPSVRRTGAARGVTLRSRAVVRESPVANSVTSWPRATSSSVTRPTTSSVPP